MKPTVGRIVHYTNLGDKDGKYPPEQQAALITKVKPMDQCAEPQSESCYSVSLHIFYETGDFYMKDVPFSDTYKRGSWTWPPREGESRMPKVFVVVNGTQHEVFTTVISYEELVAIAQHKGHPSMTWRDKDGGSGILALGGQIAIGGGLIVNVSHTDNA